MFAVNRIPSTAMAKPKNPRASTTISARVSDHDYEALVILADQHRTTVSDVVRTLLENELERHPVDDVTRAGFRKRRMEEMGIEPTRRRGLRSVRAHLDTSTMEPVQLDRFARQSSRIEKPVRSARSEALKRAA